MELCHCRRLASGRPGLRPGRRCAVRLRPLTLPALPLAFTKRGLAGRRLGGTEIDARGALRALNAVDGCARDQIAIQRDGAAGIVIAGNGIG